MTGGRYWTVLQVMPSVREEIAATMLARAGFEAFVPMERVVRRKGRRGRPVRAEALGPLFPGYVFARIGAGELGRVCALRTVPLPLADAAMPGRRCFAGALGTAGAPGRVPEAEIASLRAAVTVEGCDTLHAARFGAGDRVTLSDEARLPGGAGRVLRVEGRMLTVLAALFGREVELTLPARQCRAADVA